MKLAKDSNGRELEIHKRCHDKAARNLAKQANTPTLQKLVSACETSLVWAIILEIPEGEPGHALIREAIAGARGQAHLDMLVQDLTNNPWSKKMKTLVDGLRRAIPKEMKREFLRLCNEAGT